MPNPNLGRVDQRPALTRNVRGLLAVVAHPEDASFALGALIDRFTSCGIPVGLLCFTHAEASTPHDRADEPERLRSARLRAAARVLGVDAVQPMDYPDGKLARASREELAGHVSRMVGQVDPSHLLVFDEGGITGHPDHEAVTAAALLAARWTGREVLAWAVPQAIARRLNAEFGAGFVGRTREQVQALSVSRTRQRRAIAAHASGPLGNAVLQRRIALLRDSEHVRVLYRPGEPASCGARAVAGTR